MGAALTTGPGSPGGPGGPGRPRPPLGPGGPCEKQKSLCLIMISDEKHTLKVIRPLVRCFPHLLESRAFLRLPLSTQNNVQFKCQIHYVNNMSEIVYDTYWGSNGFWSLEKQMEIHKMKSSLWYTRPNEYSKEQMISIINNEHGIKCLFLLTGGPGGPGNPGRP